MSTPVTKTVETVVPVAVTKAPVVSSKMDIEEDVETVVPVAVTKAPVVSSKMDIEEDVEGDVEEDEDEAEAEDEVEEDEEEEGLEEFEYKGKTYYRDAEGNVYSLYEDGELNDTPVGRWNSAKGTIRFVAT